MKKIHTKVYLISAFIAVCFFGNQVLLRTATSTDRQEAIVATNILPIAHGLINSYYANDQNGLIDYFEAFYYIAFEFLFYGFGVFFYLSGYPERAFPKRFDIWMNSHTIWHIFTALALFMQFKASNIFYVERKTQILEILSME